MPFPTLLPDSLLKLSLLLRRCTRENAEAGEQRGEEMGTKQGEFIESAQGMYERLKAWRKQHPEASFDEIAEAVGRERRELMGQLLSELAAEKRLEVEALATECPTCASQTEGKGPKIRGISHLEGETKLERGYRYCGKCGRGFFPPGQATEAEQAELES